MFKLLDPYKIFHGFVETIRAKRPYDPHLKELYLEDIKKAKGQIERILTSFSSSDELEYPGWTSSLVGGLENIGDETKKGFPDPNRQTTYVLSYDQAKEILIDAQNQPQRNFNITLVGNRSTSLMRPITYTFLHRMTTIYQEKTGQTLVMTSAYRKNNPTSWHGTGYAVDIDTPNTMKRLSGGKFGFPKGKDREHARALLESAIHAGFGKIVFGDWYLLQEIKRKYSYIDVVYDPTGHYNHLHLSYPIQRGEDNE